MIVDGYVLISPEYIDANDSINYHVFEAQKDTKTNKITLKSRTSICNSVSLKSGKIKCVKFSEDLLELTADAVFTEETEFCGNCAGVAVSDENN